jgi:hypothetical protein
MTFQIDRANFSGEGRSIPTILPLATSLVQKILSTILYKIKGALGQSYLKKLKTDQLIFYLLSTCSIQSSQERNYLLSFLFVSGVFFFFSLTYLTAFTVIWKKSIIKGCLIKYLILKFCFFIIRFCEQKWKR